MAIMKETPRYNVVSVRITDEEKKTLEEATRLSKKTVASIIREALRQLTHQNEAFRK